MTLDPPAAVLRELLAIVDFDAGPTLAVFGLMQRELPRSLAICGGSLVHARFRCADAWRVELAHCAATLNTRSVNRQALRQQGVGKALIDGFIGASARPAYTSESDPFVDAFRIDLPGVSALRWLCIHDASLLDSGLFDDLALFTRNASPDARRWAELWEDREFAVETLRQSAPHRHRARQRGHGRLLRLERRRRRARAGAAGRRGD